ncbi:flagellar motor switch protein FliN [bacterium]|nr:flagellar motor switch protein FliN [bacterium]
MMPGDDEFKEINSENIEANAGSPEEVVQPFEPSMAAQESASEGSTVTVQPVQFASFEDLDQVQGPQNQNLNILLDVKLQLTVELGRTELPIKKVLELTKGSIVTLNKAAGEPVELYANGKLIAYGEVVVIEDNFGLRITHITDPAKRLHSLGSQVPPVETKS